MLFSIQLSAFYPDKSYGGDRVFNDMLELAVCADRHGYDAVSITEHHLINILMMPAPLQFATAIAARTRNVRIMTCVLVLPIHDMRTYAGEIVATDIFTEGRMLMGVSRGAFAYEMGRLGVPLETSREKFDESLDVLMALLTGEEVSWDGKYYRFEPLTIMPRPVHEPHRRIMMAAVMPEPIYHCARRGFHVQATPLSGDRGLMLDQVNAFKRGRAESGSEHLTLSMSRVAWLARDQKDKDEKIALAHRYYGMFDNVYTGDGLVDNGMIRPLPANMSLEQTARNLTIGTVQEMVDELGVYAEAGVDRFILNINFGASQAQMLETVRRFASEVMPHFSTGAARSAARAGG